MRARKRCWKAAWRPHECRCRNEYALSGGRIPATESLRVPEPGSSAPGQPAPKPRPRGVGDGKRVNSPVPERKRLTARGDAEAEEPSGLDVPMQRRSLGGEANPSAYR